MKKMLLVLLVCCCPLFAQDNVAVAVRGVELIRGQMRDPDSLVIESVYTKPDKKPDRPPKMLFCYRAKNGFGGYGREMARIEDGRIRASLSDGCGTLGSHRIARMGWVDITDEYLKVAMPAAKDAAAK
jgi:hypothetical protein